MLSDPTLSLPPSFAPGPSDGAAAYAARLGALPRSLIPGDIAHAAPPSGPGAVPAAPLSVAPLTPPTTVTTGSSFSHTSTVDFEPPPRRSGARWAAALTLLLLGGAVGVWMTRAASRDDALPPVASAPAPPVTADTPAVTPPLPIEPAAAASAKAQATAAGPPSRFAPRRGGPGAEQPGAAPPAKPDAPPPPRPAAPDLEIRRSR
jgi:hypothetical protein